MSQHNRANTVNLNIMDKLFGQQRLKDQVKTIIRLFYNKEMNTSRIIKVINIILMTPFIPVILYLYRKNKTTVDMDILRSRPSGGG